MMNGLLPSAVIVCILLLIGCCDAGVDQPPDVPLEEINAQPVSERENPDSVVDPRDPQSNQPLHPRDQDHCGSHVVIGMPGPAGPIGPQGFPGVQGSAGFPGNPGNNGNNGQPGPGGRPGGKGDKGENGFTGLPGLPGSPGSTGFTGPPGPLGAPGDPGSIGSNGTPGKHGLTGATGVAGPTGPAGTVGYTGNKGDRGVPGLRGGQGTCTCPPPDQSEHPPRPPTGGSRRSRGAKCAFSAARTTSLLATAGPVIVTYQTIFTNQGRNFDEETGVFFCAIAGTYYFTMNIYKSSADNFPLVQLLVNGDHKIAVIDYGASDTEDAASNSVILELEVGDEVYLQLYDGRELHSSHYRFTTFSGFLIFEA